MNKNIRMNFAELLRVAFLYHANKKLCLLISSSIFKLTSQLGEIFLPMNLTRLA